MRKFLFYTVILILATYSLINTLRVLYHLYGVEKQNIKSKQELEKIEKENQELKDNLIEVKSTYYLEKQARNLFSLKNPNEDVIVVEQRKNLSETASQDQNLPNWKKWLNLFSS